jgi:ABC-type nitrate/sulfonate/bicarbonate transport system permease component
MLSAGSDLTVLRRIPLAVSHAAVFILFVAAWWAFSAFSGHGFVPSPLETVRAAIKMAGDGSLAVATLQSFFSLFAGYLLAITVAVPVGMAMGGIAVVGAVLNPYVDALSSMPRIAFLPLIIVFLGAVMPILINTYAGVSHSDAELIEMARSAGASSPAIFRKIVLPGALPHIVTGLRVGASLALINTVVAELYTAVSGLGGLLSIYGNSFRMAPYFVIVAVLAMMGMLLIYCVRLVERQVMRWHIERSA